MRRRRPPPVEDRFGAVASFLGRAKASNPAGLCRGLPGRIPRGMVQVLQADEHQGFSRPDGGGRNHRRVLLPGFFAEEGDDRSEEHTSELQSRENLVCRLLLEKKKKQK